MSSVALAAAPGVRPGDVVLYRGGWGDPRDAVVMLATGAPWSHVAFGVAEGAVVEAVLPRVRRAAATRGGVAVAPPYADEAARGAAVTAALAFVGRRYDLPSLPLVALYGRVPWARALIAAFLRRFDSGSAVYCAELVAGVLAAGGVDLGLPPFVATPASVAASLGVAG